MGRHSKKITLDQLGKELANIVRDYQEDLDVSLKQAAQRAGSKGAAALRGSSASVIGGRYARGWGYTTTERRLYFDLDIWQKQVPGLPHLLEFGHAMPQGGRSRAKPHVEPVNEMLQEQFVNIIREDIEALE